MPRGRKIVPHRRVREGKTDYRQRLKLVKSGKPRLVVRRANRNMSCQIVSFDKKSDKTLVSASSIELANFGWNANTGNIPGAYLTGLLCAVRAKSAGIKEAVPDIGFFEAHHGSRVLSALKGALDGGLEIPHSKEAFPPEDRMNGAHIANYAAELKKGDNAKYEKYFSAYIKAKVDPETIAKLFETVKSKVISEGASEKKPKPVTQKKEKKATPKKEPEKE
ncbi:MAG: 50S ribosomal protein L18 [Candidatus Aenigmarchaeota archaeon]|nr:50S ribosomal protein L18 [Candidatus Aenigmarchaeota archaeon]